MTTARMRKTGTMSALPVAKRRDDNSPAFQCRVQSANVPSPAGTAGNTVPKIRVSVQPPRWGLWPCASNPALKRRAIIGLSRWDVSPLMIPAGEKFEPAHAGLLRGSECRRVSLSRRSQTKAEATAEVKDEDGKRRPLFLCMNELV